MRGSMVTMVAGLMLAGCAGRTVAPMVVPPVPLTVTIPDAPPAPTPINAGLNPAATLWHLRAGLNVAALACRGEDEATTVARYNALIRAHAAALKTAEAASAAEARAGGGEWRDRYDDGQTRLYNFFGQAGGRAAFCTAAADTLAAAAAIDDVALPNFAAAHLPLLDRPFAPPRLAVDARIFDASAVTQFASR